MSALPCRRCKRRRQDIGALWSHQRRRRGTLPCRRLVSMSRLTALCLPSPRRLVCVPTCEYLWVTCGLLAHCYTRRFTRNPWVSTRRLRVIRGNIPVRVRVGPRVLGYPWVTGDGFIRGSPVTVPKVILSAQRACHATCRVLEWVDR